MSRKHIAVLCANPALDVEWRVDGVRPEEKNRILEERCWAGGKGVNVARWLRWLGLRVRLVLPAGGAEGRELAGALRREGIPCEVVEVGAATRVNVLVTDPSGRQWRFNRSGPELRAREWRAVVERFEAALEGAALAVLSGSLPPGAPADGYAVLLGRARRVGVHTVLDCDGEALRNALAAGPFLVKPNGEELAAWWGRRFRTEQGVVRAARAMSKVSGGWVLVSRGPDPAWLIRAEPSAAHRARPPEVRLRHRLGAGDALVAGVCRSIVAGEGPERWLRGGLDTAAVCLGCEPGRLPARPAGERLRRAGLRT